VNHYNLSGLRLDPKVFQHPADKAITDTILGSDEFRKVINFIGEHALEGMLSSLYLSTYAHLTEKNAPELVCMSREAAEMFGLERAPELFIKRTYSMSSEVQCFNRPMIMLSTELLNHFSDRATWAAIAACASSVRNGYCEIEMMKRTIQNIGWLLPNGTAKAMHQMIVQWEKASQLSFDRAALIASGDLNTVMEIILGGDMPLDQMRRIDFSDPSCSYMIQCLEFAEDQGAVMNSIRTLDALYYDEMMPAVRYLALFDFYQTEYQDLLEAHMG